MKLLNLTITWTVLLVLSWSRTDANGAAFDQREQQIAEAEAFIANRPATPEAMKLRVDLAAYYRNTGRFSRSLDHWGQAWDGLKNVPDGAEKQVADIALVNGAHLMASLGRLEELRVLFKEQANRSIENDFLSMMWGRTREAVYHMGRRPDIAYKCGVFALNNVAKAMTGRNMHSIANLPSDFEGFTLAALQAVAEAHQLPLRAAFREEGSELIFPSVVHWSQNHYAAIVSEQQGLLKVIDPTFGDPAYQDPTAINEEASGYFLIPSQELPPGWRWVNADEAATVFGKGYPWKVEDDDPDCDPEKEDCCEEGDCGCTGMAVWKVFEPNLNLEVMDTPMTYPSAYGPAFDLKLVYRQRSLLYWQSYNENAHFSAGWTMDHAASVYSPGGLSQSGLPAEILYLFRGANFRHALDFAVGQTTSEVDFLSGIYAKRYEVGFILSVVDVYYPDGSVDHFEYRNSATTLQLTKRTDSSGHSLTYRYDALWNGNPRLTAVTNAPGQVFTFTYEPNPPTAVDPFQIWGVSGPDGRSVSFTYDGNGRLEKITDVVGIESSFTYSSTGAGATHIDSITTPYGTTSFYSYTPNPTEDPNGVFAGGIDRYLKVTEPDDSTQYYVFYDEVLSDSSLYTKIPTAFASDQIPDYSLGAPSFDTTDVKRNQHNTHHWNRQQSAALSDPDPLSFSAADYRISTTKHWLGKAGHPSGISTVLGWILPPSRNGTLEDLPKFYDYEGKDPGAGYTYGSHVVDYREFTGTSRKPNVICQRRPDGTTWWQETTYNAQRKKLSVSENWADGGALKTRTSTYRYASGTGDPTIDGIVLIEEKGPSAELIGGRKLHATYKDLTIELTNAVGEITVMTYNANRQLATEQTAAGLLSTFTYFTDGRLQKVVESQAGINLRTNSYTWLNGLRRTHVDPRNLTRTFDYDFLGRLTKITYGSDSTTEEFFYVLPANTGFNTTASPINVLDQVGRKDRLGYGWTNIPNRLRQVEMQIEPPRVAGQAGVENTITYCGCGSPSSIDKASNKTEIETTSYDFDYQGKPTAIYLPGSVTLNREYDRIGRLYKETDSYSLTTNIFDNLNRLIQVRNGKGLVSASGFDLRNRVVATTNSSGLWSTNVFDALGRLVIRGYADSTSGTGDGKELYGYTAGYSNPTSYTNQVGIVTSWKYDGSQRKTNEVVTGVYTNKYRFYPAGELYQLKDGKDQLTSWNYDTEGRVWKKIDANSAEILRYTNNANGWLKSRWSSAKGTTYYSYDSVGNLTNVNYPTSADLKYVYNGLNRATSDVVVGGLTVNYTYALGGQLATETVSAWSSSTLTLGYTTRLRTSLTLQQPTIGNWSQSYTYDSAKRLDTAVSPPGTFTYVYPVDTTAYKASEQVTRVSLPNTSFITNTFDTVGRQLTTILKNSGGTVLNSHSYVVNKAWQRTKQTRTDGGYVNYTYDNASEVREGLTFTSGNAAVNAENFKFGYNEAQNMTKRTNNATVTTYTVNNLNQLTSDGTYTFSYDNNGNRTGKLQTGSIFYTYDDEDQLKQAETDVSQTPVASRWKTVWTYDARGRMRTREEYSFNTASGWVLSTSTRYLYDGRRVIQERNSSNLPLVTYVRSLDLSGSFEGAGGIGGMLSRTAHSGANGATLTHAFYHTDANGNITKMIDNSQASVADYKYDPFGRTISSSGTLANANTYRFSSKELMGSSGFYYYGFRFYDPITQRWPNRDPLGEGGGFNLYRAFENDPCNNIDPDGQQAVATPGPNISSLVERIINTLNQNKINAARASCGAHSPNGSDWCCVLVVVTSGHSGTTVQSVPIVVSAQAILQMSKCSQGCPPVLTPPSNGSVILTKEPW